MFPSVCFEDASISLQTGIEWNRSTGVLGVTCAGEL